MKSNGSFGTIRPLALAVFAACMFTLPHGAAADPAAQPSDRTVQHLSPADSAGRAVDNLLKAVRLEAGVVTHAGVLGGVHGGRRDHLPSVYLLETRPIETKIGNPEIADALYAWMTELHAAQKTIDLEEFYLSDMPAEPMRQVLDELGRAAARGVKIRLLLDARLGATYPEPADSLGKLENFQVRHVDFGRLAGGVQHSKYFLVDHRTVVLGSQNTDWRSLEHIHELGVCVRDSALAKVFQDVFELDWKLAADTAHARELVKAAAETVPAVFHAATFQGEDVEIRPSYSPRGWLPDSTKWDRDAIVASMDAARSEIVIQVLNYAVRGYHDEDAALDSGLRRAAARGVRVKLLVSDWNTSRSGVAAMKGLLGVPNVEVRMGTVPEWSRAYIPFARVEHCKYMVVDTLLTWVGTSNWEPSYFHNTRNIAVTLKSRTLALQARKSFEASWGSDIAKPVLKDVESTPKEHGETGPPGRKVYGK